MLGMYDILGIMCAKQSICEGNQDLEQPHKTKPIACPGSESNYMLQGELDDREFSLRDTY